MSISQERAQHLADLSLGNNTQRELDELRISHTRLVQALERIIGMHTPVVFGCPCHACFASDALSKARDIEARRDIGE